MLGWFSGDQHFFEPRWSQNGNGGNNGNDGNSGDNDDDGSDDEDRGRDGEGGGGDGQVGGRTGGRLDGPILFSFLISQSNTVGARNETTRAKPLIHTCLLYPCSHSGFDVCQLTKGTFR